MYGYQDKEAMWSEIVSFASLINTYNSVYGTVHLQIYTKYVLHSLNTVLLFVEYNVVVFLYQCCVATPSMCDYVVHVTI